MVASTLNYGVYSIKPTETARPPGRIRGLAARRNPTDVKAKLVDLCDSLGGFVAAAQPHLNEQTDSGRVNPNVTG